MTLESAPNRAIRLGEFVEALKGRRVRAAEQLSWRVGAGFERHSTIRTEFSFSVTHTMWQMSGGHYIMSGDDGFQYSIGTTHLKDVEIDGNQLVATEVYGTEAERRSTLTILPSMVT